MLGSSCLQSIGEQRCKTIRPKETGLSLSASLPHLGKTRKTQGEKKKAVNTGPRLGA
jgi:hypothetical protein